MSARPPRIARWIISAATEPEERPWLLADLDQMYEARRTRGVSSARFWYYGQVVRSIPHLIAHRFQNHPTVITTSDETTMPLAHEINRPERFALSMYTLRHAFRRLIREPAFTVAAVLTLAMGVGGTIAVFAVVEAVLLRALPYPNADRIVILAFHDQHAGITKEFVPFGDYTDIVARQQTFDAIGAYGGGSTTIFGAAEPYRATVISMTDGAAAAVGLRPVLGRSIEAADTRLGGPPVLLLSYQYWRDKMGSDPNVIGQSIRVGQTSRTIVGVAPPGFRFRNTKPADLIMPMIFPAQISASRRGGFTFIVARLRAGKTIADGTADLARISKQLEKEYPETNLAVSVSPLPLRDALAGPTKPALMLLLGAVAVVMLIACANVANLLLARSLARRREMAVRIALGAGRARLASQLMAESLVLAVVSAALGVAFAYWGSRALVTLIPPSVQAPGLSDVHINANVLGFAIALTMLTTIAFGLVTLATVKRDSAAIALVGSGRSSSTNGARRTASGLIVVEVALAVVLLVGAGLILRTFSGLLSVDPGFRYERVMTISTAIPADRYRDTIARQGYYASANAALRAVSGVQEIGEAAVTPLTGNLWTVPFQRVDQTLGQGERPPEVGWQSASGGFFKALSIPLIAGRLFNENDLPSGPSVVIVSDALAKRFYPGENAVGKMIVNGQSTAQIIGVVGNIRRAGLRDDPRPDMYFPFEQNPQTQTTFFIRTAGNPDKSLLALQAALKSVESKTVFVESQSLANVAAESVRTTKLILWLLGVFAAMAVLLAAVGIYGVMSYVVRQRTREIGTRMALGATGSDIVWMIMREGAVIAGIGAAVGLAIGLAAERSLDSILFGVTATDPVTMSLATVTLLFAILAACYVPARRAAAVDPAKTLAEQ